jgi:aspartyl-tRNA synthetase
MMATRKQNNPTSAAKQLQEGYWKAITEKKEQELQETKAAWKHLQEIDIPQLEERIREQSRLNDELRVLLEEEAWIDPLVATPEERKDVRLPSRARAGKEYSFYEAILRKIKDKSVFVSGLFWYYGGDGWKIPKSVIVVAYRVFKKPAFIGDGE